MKRIFAFFLFIFLLSGCAFFRHPPAGLLVSSRPKGKVFLDGEYLGDTPFREDHLKSGEHTLKITANNLSWSTKLKLNPGVLTVVNRELADNEASESGEIISLNKGKGLAVISRPTKAEVFLDGNRVGETPLVLEKVRACDHTIQLKKEGYLERIVKVRTREGYKMTVNVQLARKISPTPSPVELLPPPSAEPSGPYIIVKETGTSFGLHVRSGPGLGHPVIEDIKPGGKYPVLGEEKGWVNIRLPDGREGWVSGRYVNKIE